MDGLIDHQLAEGQVVVAVAAAGRHVVAGFRILHPFSLQLDILRCVPVSLDKACEYKVNERRRLVRARFN